MIITCEHGGNQVPASFQHLFTGQESVLTSHRGWDPGTLKVANLLAQKLREPLFSMEVSRLLIEMNRSLDNPELFSEFSKDLDSEDKQLLLSQYYFPYREKIMDALYQKIEEKKRAIHISVHSFTPVLNHVVRETDIGLLFDPNRKEELHFCETWKEQMEILVPQFRIRFNYPYLGTDDGLTTYLRTKFPEEQYLGIEVEINQKYVDKPEMDKISHALACSLGYLRVQNN